MKSRGKLVIVIAIVLISIGIEYNPIYAQKKVSPTKNKTLIPEVYEYKSWLKVTANPYSTNFVIDGLAWDAGPIIGDDSKAVKPSKLGKLEKMARKSDGSTYGNIYINDIAKTAFNFNQKEPILPTRRIIVEEPIIFPIGSIIVREKLVKKDTLVVSSLAVMIKHDIQFNPKAGGWQFLYLDPNTFVVTLNNQSLCLVCHQTKQGSDFVFRTYMPKDKPRPDLEDLQWLFGS